MIDKREVEEALEEELMEIRERITELTEKLDNLQAELDENNNGSEFKERKAKSDRLYKDLDEKGKKVLATRAALEKKMKNCKRFGVLIFIAYVLLVGGGFYVFNVGFRFVTYLIAAVIGVIISVIYVVVTKAPLKRKHIDTYGDPDIIEYDKKMSEFFNECLETYNTKKANGARLNSEKQDIKRELKELNESEIYVLNEIRELDFNYAYNDTILFYGKDKGNYYDIYLDGHLYDTVKGRRIVKIILSPGIHSFKVDNTCYNVDRSVIYSYIFNTRQIVAGERIAAYPIVCEYNNIKQVSGSEFQKITKTQLL